MLRLTGGIFKGRKLKTPEGLISRPTSNKVRMALFNILQDEIINSTWLDLFSGVGTIGIEALSRGALNAIFVENNYKTISCLYYNIEKLQLSEKTKIYKKNVIDFLKNCNLKVDFIFIDPPYKENHLYLETLNIIMEKDLLQEKGIIIVEHYTKFNIKEIKFLKLLKQYVYGDTLLSFFQLLKFNTIYLQENKNN